MNPLKWSIALAFCLICPTGALAQSPLTLEECVKVQEAVERPAQASGPIGPGHPAFGPRTGCAFKSDLSRALRDMPPLPLAKVREDKEREVPNQPPPSRFLGKEMAGVDPVV